MDKIMNIEELISNYDSDILDILGKLDPRWQDYMKKYVHVTNHSNDYKLRGIQSISTSVLWNRWCMARRELKGAVCQKCYAEHLVKARKDLHNCLISNYILLTSHMLDDREIARILLDTRYVRIESFGDVANVTQARNYIHIILANPDIRFAIWSKNKAIWRKAFALEGKPENCTFVYSSLYVNKAEVITLDDWFIDHVFTVWDDEHYASFRGTPSECAGLSCRACLKCYTKNSQFYINEELRTGKKPKAGKKAG